MASYQHNRYIGDVANRGNTMFGFGQELQQIFNSSVPGTIQNLMESMNIDAQQKAASASARVGDEFSKQRDAVIRQASRMGVNPNSGRFRALQDKWAMAEAAARAGAATKALEDADDQEFMRGSALAKLGMSAGNMGLSAMVHGGSLLNSAMNGQYYKNAKDYEIDKDVQERRGWAKEWDNGYSKGAGKRDIKGAGKRDIKGAGKRDIKRIEDGEDGFYYDRSPTGRKITRFKLKNWGSKSSNDKKLYDKSVVNGTATGYVSK